MARENWETLHNSGETSATTVGTPVTNTTERTILTPGGIAAPVLLSGILVPGSIIRLTAAGIFSTTATPAITFSLVWGGSEEVLATTAAITVGTAAAERTWNAELILRLLTTGSEGKVLVRGRLHGIEARS